MAKEITPAFYWDLSDFPVFVKNELTRRIGSSQGKPAYSESTDYTQNLYSHPTVAWSRVCSNAIVGNRAGFVMAGLSTAGFKSRYGFLQDVNGSILGYTADGKTKHIIENERFKHRPGPGITSIETALSGGDGKFRLTTIKWKCWSTDQLTYMTPYWLTNGVSVSVEFGFNNYNPMSQLELNDVSLMLKYFYDGREIPNKVELSNGNYDASIGTIANFDYDLKDDGSYDCVTIVKNVGGYFSGTYSTGRSSKSSEFADSENLQWKKFVENQMQYFLLGAARRNHELKRETIFSQVFYSRSKDFDPIRGNKSSNDFDANPNNDNWWMSFGLFIEILNSKMSVLDNKTDNPIFHIDINDSIISAHPNLKSCDGTTLLIPNSTCPDISIGNSSIPHITGAGRWQNTHPPVASPIKNITSSTDPDLSDANEILQKTSSDLNAHSSSRVNVIRYDLNKIINWWASDPSSLAFPSKSDDSRSKKYTSGYLKNLYINFNIIKNLKSMDSFKSMIEEILKLMNSAAGDIWDFEIVPLSVDGSGNGKMTIIDKNYSNMQKLADVKNIWNFEYNNNLSIIRELNFSVKSTDVVANQTLFGAGQKIVGQIIVPSSNGSVDQTVNLPVGVVSNDRLLSGCKEVPPKNIKVKKEEPSEKDQLQDHVICREATPSRFLYTKGDITYSFVEKDKEIQRGLIYAGKSNTLRFNAIQPGIELKLKIQGISGIRNLHTFTVNDLPPPYGTDCFFQVENVEHFIGNSDWTSTITAGVRRKPLT